MRFSRQDDKGRGLKTTASRKKPPMAAAETIRIGNENARQRRAKILCIL
jgi:hypothetical protein